MRFPPKVKINTSIKQLLYDIEVVKTSYKLHPVPSERAVQLRRQSLLKSSLFSARIEGSPLELNDLANLGESKTDVKKIEVANLVAAYEQLPAFVGEKLTTDHLLQLHQMVLKDISGDAGSLRVEDSAIFSMAGVAVYLPPRWQSLPSLLNDLCKYLAMATDPAPVAAAVAHIWFEKIHPFLDGNGRVGRLVSALIVKRGEYDFGGLVPFEQYLDEHRDEYYAALQADRQDVCSFVEFYLTALLSQARQSLSLAYEPGEPDKYAGLLPRRAEIMRIVKDHKIVTFDFLSRRFRAVPPRTLHNDIAQLIKSGFLRKRGATRGAVYEPVT